MEEKSKRLSWTQYAIVTFVLMLVIYPLSSGPATWLESRGYLHPTALDAAWCFYFPLRYLYENGPQPCREAIEAWVNFWI